MTHQQQVAERLAQLRREKSARERRDVLQSEIAEAAGVSVVTYGRYENGRRKIPDEVILQLADYYAVTPAFIRYGEPVRGTLTNDPAQVEQMAREALKRMPRGPAAGEAVANGPTRTKPPRDDQ